MLVASSRIADLVAHDRVRDLLIFSLPPHQELRLLRAGTYRLAIVALGVAGHPLLRAAELLELDDGQVHLLAGAGAVDLVRLAEGGVAGVLLNQAHLPVTAPSEIHETSSRAFERKGITSSDVMWTVLE